MNKQNKKDLNARHEPDITLEIPWWVELEEVVREMQRIEFETQEDEFEYWSHYWGL